MNRGFDMSESSNTLKSKIKALEGFRDFFDALGYIGVFVPLLIVGCIEISNTIDYYHFPLSTGLWFALMTCSAIALFETYMLTSFKEYADEFYKELINIKKNFAEHRTHLLYQQIFYTVVGAIVICSVGVGVFAGICFGFVFSNFFHMGFVTTKEVESLKRKLDLEG